MSIGSKHQINNSGGLRMAVGLAALALVVAGCTSGPGERAGEMTSYSSKEAKGATPELFTIPQNQVSHVQVVTVALRKSDHRPFGDPRVLLEVAR